MEVIWMTVISEITSLRLSETVLGDRWLVSEKVRSSSAGMQLCDHKFERNTHTQR